MRLIDADELKIMEDDYNQLDMHYLTEEDLTFLAYYEIVQDAIKNAPTIDAKPIVHAEWLSSEAIYSKFKCSNCGYEFCACAILHEKFELPNYCQNCGAKMDLEDGD